MQITRLALLSFLAPATFAQGLLVPESTNDRIMLFDANDGQLIDANFIDLAALGTPAETPIEAREVAGEIWISDQIADVIIRLSGDGTSYLGDYGAGRDNIRGFEVVSGGIWLANSGPGQAGFGDVIKNYDTGGMLLSMTAAPDPFDVVSFGGDLLVSNISDENIERFDASGTFIGTFHDSDGISGIDFPEQLSTTSSGTVLAAGFSAPSGIYEYDATGAEIQYINTVAAGLGGVRGVHELGNGNIIFTNGGGVHVWDVVAGTATTVAAGVSGRFISEFSGGGDIDTSFCTPALPNSSGGAAIIEATGSPIAGGNPLTLTASQMPLSQFGFFLAGQTMGMAIPPGSAGVMCLSGNIGRFSLPGQIQNTGMTGSFSLAVDTNAIPVIPPTAIAAGETWLFQAWFRDGATSNFTNGSSVVFQ